MPPTTVKDPKKVEAGRKGAAARQAKKEQLLSELREAKAATLHATSRSAVVPTAEPVPERQGTASEQQATDWTPYIIGGLGIAGAVMLALSSGATSHQLQGNNSAAARSVEPARPVERHKQAPDTHLKTQPDPFIMQ